MWVTVLTVHIACGVAGVVTGALALAVPKGSDRHRSYGVVFSVAMLTMAFGAAYLAIALKQPDNFFSAALTMYLVATAWRTLRRTHGATAFDWIAFAFVTAVALGLLGYGIAAARSATGKIRGVPAAIFFFMALAAVVAAVGDVRVLREGGITGRRRIARHLWRMCYACFIASGSFFLGRARLFPALMRKTHMLTFLTVLPLFILCYWLIRLKKAKLALAR